MSNADTAIVANGIFFHYCHKIRGFMALRIHHFNCPMCLQKNPAYIDNTIIFTVSNLLTGNIVMSFADQAKAINFLQENHKEPWALGDTGYVQ